MNLHLPLKGEYFDQIKDGTKKEEFRLCTEYWKKRLEGREYDSIVLTKGYPKKDDRDRVLVVPWKGFSVKTIRHPFFGEEPVTVYAIAVEFGSDEQ